MLTPSMAKTLTFLKAFHAEHGFSPSFREIMAELGINSSARVHALLKGLEERGHIRRMQRRSRAIEVVENPTLPDMLTGFSNRDLAQEAKRRGLALGHLVRNMDGEIVQSHRFVPISTGEQNE